MRINLYDNPSYPMRKDGMPDIGESPVGYFEASSDDVQRMIDGEVRTINGYFIYNSGIKPRIGEHLIVDFVLNENRGIYNSTTSYAHRIELEIDKHKEWEATLSFTLNK